jgi:uncharacterized protein YggU (UPF0235/DUF167 family)
MSGKLLKMPQSHVEIKVRFNCTERNIQGMNKWESLLKDALRSNSPPRANDSLTQYLK